MAGGKRKKGIAHVVAVNMGYGHERPAHVLRDLSTHGKVTIANDYDSIPESDRNLWDSSRRIYEKISRFKKVPILGKVAFGAMDKIQRIPEFYPRRDLSRPSLQVLEMYALIRRRKWCKHLIEMLAENPIPFIATYMVPGFAAEEFGYPGDIYMVVTDADMSRAWVAKDPKRSRIKYFAPNGRVVERLKLYGVRPGNIELTGFPLPHEAIGGAKSETAIKNLGRRICNLDPNGFFMSRAQGTLKAKLGLKTCKLIAGKRPKPIHIAFAIGGAGAQRELGITIAKSLQNEIKRGKIRLTLIAGTRPEVSRYFNEELKKLGLASALKKEESIDILYKTNRQEYFDAFTALMNRIDILWTKPSELSFYTGIGIPIIMAPTVGSQEDFNHKWLEQTGGGIDQLDPRYTNEWLFDWINSGALARMAWNGFIEAPTHGAYRIEDIILGRPNTIHPHPLVV
jgi:hypothetical protein